MNDMETPQDTTSIESAPPPNGLSNGTTEAHAADEPKAPIKTKDASSLVREAKDLMRSLRTGKTRLVGIRKELVDCVEEIDEEVAELAVGSLPISAGPAAAARPIARAKARPSTRPARPLAVSSIAPPAPAPVARKAAAAPKETAAPREIQRRSSDQIREQLRDLCAMLSKHPEGVRSEQLQRELNVDRKAMPLLLKTALNQKLLKKKGERRATMYFAR